MALWYCLSVLAVLCLTNSLQGVCSIEIYVDAENGVSNSSCWTGGEDIPCKTVHLGLRGLQSHDHSTLFINNGTYHLNGTVMHDYQFLYMNNIGIRSSHDRSDINLTVTIRCENEVGLTFLYSSNITISGIEMVGCGMLHNSTSQNFTELLKDNKFVFALFYTAMYFIYCEDVQLHHIHVTESIGIGTVFYSTVGTNFIENSCFSLNSVPVEYRDHYPGGGGLYIEFSYCTPINTDNNNCSVNSNVPEYYTENAEYYIRSSTFQENYATIVNPQDHTFILPHLRTHLAFGRGGGISVFFKGNASNNTVAVSESKLLGNMALWGAGLFVEYQDMSQNNRFFIENSTLDSNQCFNSSSEAGTGGGGARLGFIFFGKTHSQNNSMIFSSVDFVNNTAYFGGGLSFYTAREDSITATNHLEFTECVWHRNVARVGTAVDLSVWHPVAEGAVVKPIFQSCNFTSNSASYTLPLKHNSGFGTFVGIGALYSDSIPITFIQDVLFQSNTQTALAAVGTGVYFEEGTSATFLGNSGRKGGAVALMGYAFIVVSENTTLNFINNNADLKGGAIYGHSIGEHDLISSRNCFIRYKHINSTPTEWKVIFFFENNTANMKTNSIYVTSLLTCLWGGAFGSTDQDSAAEKVFCWKNSSHQFPMWKYENSTCSQNIATSPAHFSSQNTSDTSPYIEMDVFPGKRKILPTFSIDDRGHNATEYTVLVAEFEKSDGADQLYLDSSSVYISDNSVEIHGKPTTQPGSLKLETIDPRVISTHINVTVYPCPPGMIHTTENNRYSCTCGHQYSGLIKCNATDYSANIARGGWIGNISEDGAFLVGQCPYCAAINSQQYFRLPQKASQLESELCGSINRKNTLCGKCIETYGPSVNSKNFECLPCSDSAKRQNWFYYILTEFLPITIFFFVVVFFNVSVTSGPANAFVFFAQIVTTAITLDGDGLIQVEDAIPNASIAENLLHVIPYDIWNLNFFRPYLPSFCLSPDISTLTLLSTGYITAFYPLVLVGIFYSFTWLYSQGFRPIVCLCRPIHYCFARLNRIWDFQRSIVHALATFIVLSYTKFTLVSFILLTTTPLINDDGKTNSTRLYYDGSIEFGKGDHLPYLIVSVIVLLTFVTLPPIILVAPSIVHFLQNKVCTRFPDCCGGATFGQFLTAFHGCYKDGTGGPGGDENKHDFRWFAGLYFFLRFILLAIFAFTPDWFFQCVLQQIVCTAAFLVFVILRPYKNDLYNKVDATIFAIIVALCSITMYNYYLTVLGSNLPVWTFVLQYFLIVCPLGYITVVVLYHLWNRNKIFLKKCFKKLFKKRVNTTVAAGDLIQDDDEFLHDAEQAGRFGGDEVDSRWSRPISAVQNDDSQPLLQNEQSPHRSTGSSSNSTEAKRESNQSDTGYGAMTQSPSPGSNFGETGVVQFQIDRVSGESRVDIDSLTKRRKKLFFTH